MIPIWIFLRKIGKTIKRGVVGSSLSTILVIIYGTLSEYYLENPVKSSGIHSLFSSLWWTMQTLTTVGYGDTPVIGYAGKLNAMVIMVVGIGSIGYLLASVSADIVNSNFSKRIGRVKLRLKKHVVVCNFDSAGKDIVQDLNERSYPVVIVSKKEIKEEGLEFDYVKGSCLEDESLANAGISNCDTAVILGGRTAMDEDMAEVDARTILMGMSIKRKNPNVYVIAEVLESSNESHAISSGIDEVIVKGRVSSSLISGSILAPGVTKVLKRLISGDGDFEVSEVSLKKYSGKKFSSVYDDFKEKGKFILGFRKGASVVSDMPSDQNVDGHSVIVLSKRR